MVFSSVGVVFRDADVVGSERTRVVLMAGVKFQEIELATRSQEPRQRTKATAYKQIEFRSMLDRYHGMRWGPVKPRHRYCSATYSDLVGAGVKCVCAVPICTDQRDKDNQIKGIKKN